VGVGDGVGGGAVTGADIVGSLGPDVAVKGTLVTGSAMGTVGIAIAGISFEVTRVGDAAGRGPHAMLAVIRIAAAITRNAI